MGVATWDEHVVGPSPADRVTQVSVEAPTFGQEHTGIGLGQTRLEPDPSGQGCEESLKLPRSSADLGQSDDHVFRHLRQAGQ
jgi:hypothetical protein